MKNPLGWLLFAMALCAGTATTQAQLGETGADWEARCGEPIEQGKSESRVGDWRAYYRHGGWNYVVTFWHGRTGRYGVERLDGAALSAAETAKLLAANADGRSWSNPEQKTDKRGNPVMVWWRSDGAAAFSMVYSTGVVGLVFQTKEFSDALTAARDAMPQKN